MAWSLPAYSNRERFGELQRQRSALGKVYFLSAGRQHVRCSSAAADGRANGCAFLAAGNRSDDRAPCGWRADLQRILFLRRRRRAPDRAAGDAVLRAVLAGGNGGEV